MMTRETKTNARISQARVLRDASIARIRQFTEKMEQLVNSSVDADDLERSINAMDYRLLRQELEAEQDNFKNLNQLLNRLQTCKLTEIRVSDAKETLRGRSAVDVDRLIAREDYLAAQNEFLREEDEKFRAIAADTASTYATIPADLDFETLVTRAAVKRSLKALPEEGR